MFRSPLTYAVEQPYRLKRIKPLFFGCSAIFIILLVLLNLVLAGYDTATAARADPNVTDYPQWWAPKSLPTALKIHTKPGDCEDTSLEYNKPYRTNSPLPLFAYALANDFDEYAALKDVDDLRPKTPYKANQMDICRITGMSVRMDLKWISYNCVATILCEAVGDPPRERQFRTTFNRAWSPRFQPDSIIDFMAYITSPDQLNSSRTQRDFSQNGPPSNAYFNVLGVVDALGSDLLQTLWMRVDTWGPINNGSQVPVPPVPDIGYMSWDPTNPSNPFELGAYRDGHPTVDDSYIRPINTTIVNMFVAIRDAIQIDLGYQNTTSTNVYFNKTAFDTLIRPDPFFTQLSSITAAAHPEIIQNGVCCWGWGCTRNVSESWAQALTSTNSFHNLTLPIKGPPPRSVLAMVYLCPQYQMKSWGSVVVAVFTGTFTMYLTVYAIFVWFATILDKKYYGPQPLEQLAKPPNPTTQEKLQSREEDGNLLHSNHGVEEHLLGQTRAKTV
ncbi:hypothetical protein FRC12_012731 [Ceratobasidium sp. 428]|nr:hypothetical protein FRC12_012731 [Ceratobasidium sp. 428]